jgi:hypothetical protein
MAIKFDFKKILPISKGHSGNNIQLRYQFFSTNNGKTNRLIISLPVYLANKIDIEVGDMVQVHYAEDSVSGKNILLVSRGDDANPGHFKAAVYGKSSVKFSFLCSHLGPLSCNYDTSSKYPYHEIIKEGKDKYLVFAID